MYNAVILCYTEHMVYIRSDMHSGNHGQNSPLEIQNFPSSIPIFPLPNILFSLPFLQGQTMTNTALL